MGVIFTNGLGVGVMPNTSGWIKVTNNGGDGSISQTGQTIFNIVGPNNSGGSEWLYIKKQFQTSGTLWVDYTWNNPDAGEDWPMFDVSNTEPTGALSSMGQSQLQNNGANDETGTWSISYNAGDWVSIGVYSTDSCCGFGTLNITLNSYIFWNRYYISQYLVTYPNIASYAAMAFNGATTYKTSISDGAPGVYSALGEVGIAVGQKKMVSFSLDGDDESNPANYWIGVGTTATDLNNNLGNDNNSYGFNNLGDLYYGGGSIETGYPTFGTVGDIIDVAIHGGNLMWYRINGGAWNGNNSADPSTGAYGIDISGLQTTVYPALSILGDQGPSLFSVFDNSPYAIPNGYTLIPGDKPAYSFTITDTQFSYLNVVCGSAQGQPNGVSGFTITSTSDLACGVYGDLTNTTQIENAFINSGAGLGWNGVICEVTWGPGSSITNGIAKVAYVGSGSNYRTLITSVDPTDTNYLNNNNNANGTSLAGTFNFPATFKIVLPIDHKGGWC